jgi:hypothetical protein
LAHSPSSALAASSPYGEPAARWVRLSTRTPITVVRGSRGKARIDPSRAARTADTGPARAACFASGEAARGKGAHPGGSESFRGKGGPRNGERATPPLSSSQAEGTRDSPRCDEFTCSPSRGDYREAAGGAAGQVAAGNRLCQMKVQAGRTRGGWSPVAGAKLGGEVRRNRRPRQRAQVRRPSKREGVCVPPETRRERRHIERNLN